MRPENLLKISSTPEVRADYLLTGVIDKDLIVENIIDECNTLYHKD